MTTQSLLAEHGDEQAALASVYSIFPTTRDIIRHHGRDCIEFSKLAIVVLNQIIRPFCAKWHRLSHEGVFDQPARCSEFRTELAPLQQQLLRYTRMLGDMARVEQDLTELETLHELE